MMPRRPQSGARDVLPPERRTRLLEQAAMVARAAQASQRARTASPLLRGACAPLHVPLHVRAVIWAAGAAADPLDVRTAGASELLEITISGRRGADLKLRRPSSRDAEVS
eukprot:scaffold132577_cov36-Phaeocystis_antarctica.AAC.2